MEFLCNRRDADPGGDYRAGLSLMNLVGAVPLGGFRLTSAAILGHPTPAITT
jgi:hypothetical protein